MSESEAKTTIFTGSVDGRHVSKFEWVKEKYKDTRGIDVEAAPTRRRGKSTKIQRRDEVLTSIREDAPLNEYANRLNRMNPPLLIPAKWLAEGCPQTYPAAIKDSKWRHRVSMERLNAWSRKGKKRLK